MHMTHSPTLASYVSCPGPQPQHPDSSPESVAAAQLEAVHLELPSVLRAWTARRLYPTDDQLIDCLSHATDLPIWNVRRKLEELGTINPVSERRPPDEAERTKIISDYLATRGDEFTTLPKIAQETKLKALAVRSVIVWNTKLFERTVIHYNHKAHRYAYRLKKRGKARAS